MARSTRDIIQEIVDVRQRRHFNSAMQELPSRLFELSRAFQECNPHQAELIRYFPVGIVACMEGYFRMAISELIDSGDAFLGNSEKIALSIKFDFQAIKAVHGKSITIGELISHGIPLSRLEHIDGTMTALLGSNFLETLRTTTDRVLHEVYKLPAKPILDDPQQIYSDVARTFELRHIICHEVASAYKIEYSEIERCLKNCIVFLKAADALVSDTIHPGYPLTQTDLNIAAGQSLSLALAELNSAMEKVRATMDAEELAAFDFSQKEWESYADAWVAFIVGDRANSGTIWPLLYAGAKETVVRHRLEEVSGWRRLGDSGGAANAESVRMFQ